MRDEVTRNGVPHALAYNSHNKPEERSLATGSETATGSRRKNQRATAKPNAT